MYIVIQSRQKKLSRGYQRVGYLLCPDDASKQTIQQSSKFGQYDKKKPQIPAAPSMHSTHFRLKEGYKTRE